MSRAWHWQQVPAAVTLEPRPGTLTFTSRLQWVRGLLQSICRATHRPLSPVCTTSKPQAAMPISAVRQHLHQHTLAVLQSSKRQYSIIHRVNHQHPHNPLSCSTCGPAAVMPHSRLAGGQPLVPTHSNTTPALPPTSASNHSMPPQHSRQQATRVHTPAPVTHTLNANQSRGSHQAGTTAATATVCAERSSQLTRRAWRSELGIAAHARDRNHVKPLSRPPPGERAPGLRNSAPPHNPRNHSNVCSTRCGQCTGGDVDGPKCTLMPPYPDTQCHRERHRHQQAA